MPIATIEPGPEAQPCRACRHPPTRSHGQGTAITNLGDMRREANSGCTACSVLIQGIRAVLENDPTLDDEARDSANWLRIDFNMAASCQSLEMFIFGPRMPISVFVPTKTPELQRIFPNVRTGLAIPPTTASDSSLAWLRDKLRQCEACHTSCRNRSDLTWAAPRRMLDVGSSENCSVRLHDFGTNNINEYYQYACLSHCWGHSRPLSTLSTNLKSHFEGIPWHMLPLTFQHAISYVRKLGIRYLWIDSLCIIQDDTNDWRQEAAKMAAIYQNSFLVISASKSRGPDGGLFSDIDPSFNTHKIAVPIQSGESRELCFRRSFAHVPGFMDQNLKTTPSLPTFTRGWIFQERFLSPRVIHFGPQELSWECLEDSACQCSEAHSRPAIQTSSGASTLGSFNSAIERVSRPKAYYNEEHWRSLQGDELAVCWHRLVEDYTSLYLTYQKDIFPAISGIAKSFQSVVKSNYTAGLWEKSLLNDLAWHAESISKSSVGKDGWVHRPQTWRAPTWSWAAATCPVKFIDLVGGWTALCDVVEACCTTAGPDPTGELTGGQLLLRGCLIPTTLQYLPLGESEIRQPFKLFDLEMAQGQVTNVWADYDSSLPGPGHIQAGVKVYGLLLMEKVASGALELLLLKIVGEDEVRCCQVYERLGLVEISRPPTAMKAGKGYWTDIFASKIGKQVMVKII